MLTFHSPHEVALSKAEQKRTWEAFMNGGTAHSSRASTLPYILRRCEQEGVEYILEAAPKYGYFIKPRSR